MDRKIAEPVKMRETAQVYHHALSLWDWLTDQLQITSSQPLRQLTFTIDQEKQDLTIYT